MPLPCENIKRIIKQIAPAREMLLNLNEEHPDVLKSHGLNPADYHDGLVFRSAVESIRGHFIAGAMRGRQDLVEDVLYLAKEKGLIHAYQATGRGARYDFEAIIDPERRRRLAIEVKGGEGNSINISERPLWADEFVVWCHLDGAVVNQPEKNANAIIFGRVSRFIVKDRKQIDVVIIKDRLCGTSARPCPKYPKGSKSPLGVAPCIFLMPVSPPTEENPEPAVHDIGTAIFPKIILAAFGVNPKGYDKNVYYVSISLRRDDKGVMRKTTTVSYKGEIVGERSVKL
jgi:hypothetical protein